MLESHHNPVHRACQHPQLSPSRSVCAITSKGISSQAVICGQPYIYECLLLQLVLQCVHYLLTPQHLTAALVCSLNGSLGLIQDFLISFLLKSVTTTY